ASHPANVIVVRLTASEPGRLSLAARLEGAHPGARVEAAGADLVLSGRVPDGAIRYEARLRVETDGRVEASGGTLTIREASEATLVLAGATNFVDYRDVSADPAARNAATLDALRGRSYDALRDEHVADHRELFRR